MPPSRHGMHSRPLTAFRLPEDLLAWLHAAAARDSTTMTAIVIAALQHYKETVDGKGIIQI